MTAWMAEPVGIMWTTIEEGFTMEEERRVRYTDDYVPGPEGCPVWMIEMLKIYSLPLFVRAKTGDEAMEIFKKYYEEHSEELEKYLDEDSDPYGETNVYYHARPDYGWKK